MTNESPTSEQTPLLLGKPYDILKQIVQLWIPALSTLYFVLGSIWSFPGVEKAIGSLAALATFGGVLLGLSSRAYYKSDARFVGQIVVHEKEGGGKLYSLELNGDPSELLDQKTVTFKVDSKKIDPQI